MIELPLGYQDIIEILPHRYPFLFVDKIIELELGKRVVGLKGVTINEPFFQGHFPGNPVMPGVLIIEGLAQTGGILGRLTMAESKGIPVAELGSATLFMGIDKVKFRKPVVPGDRVRYEVDALRTGTKVWKVAGKAHVGENLVTEAELLASIG
jgi:beta-hydroxyacyl-ACP dehydratase FabZ